MKRREFITLLGGAAAWPCGARTAAPGHTGQWTRARAHEIIRDLEVLIIVKEKRNG